MSISEGLARVTSTVQFKIDVRRRLFAQHQALKALKNASPRRIVIGSSGTGFAGWISTDQKILDLLRERTWRRYFTPDSLDAILAEHVWEHLPADSAEIAAAMCFRFLRPGGHLRIAVPDGFHPDPSYIDAVKPGGSGLGSDDHKVLYTHRSISALLSKVGFDVRLHEYFDESGQFHFSEWDVADGMIERSKRFDTRNAGGALVYTSIVLDAVKPQHTRHADR